jgi:hypothetical protein
MRPDHLPAEHASAIRIWLELDLDAEPIEGTLTPPREGPSRFVGWLGLTAALEGLHRAHAPNEEGRSAPRR